jgi:hypothetical protein
MKWSLLPHEEKAVRFFYENEEDIEDVEVADSSVSFSFLLSPTLIHRAIFR